VDASTVATDERAVIDTTEVDARLRGYRLALQSLGEEFTTNEPWTTERIEHALTTLEDLSQRRSDLMLYKNVLPAEERKELESLDSLTEYSKQLSAKIADARSQLAASAAGAPSTDESKKLDELARRIVALGKN
jgi:hypothetical protein